jgi:tetrahydromethanopterin S-methyltransferase subunit B
MTLQSAIRSIRDRMSPKRRHEIQRLLNSRFRGLQRLAERLLFSSNLDTLALINSTDKNTYHRYTQHYARYLARFRKARVVVLEIGIGGMDDNGNYDAPHLGGGSLRMWRTYFPRGRIYGIDIYDKSPHDERRIKTFQGSQADTAFLQRVLDVTGPPDIVIDDGSHRCDHIITSFEYLFPRMKERGVYVVEDLQTSYWPSYGGDDQDPDRPGTAMGYFKNLVHGLNYEERPSRKDSPTYYDRNILGINFYHNILFIAKGPNTEGGAPWLRESAARIAAPSDEPGSPDVTPKDRAPSTLQP